MHSRGEAQHIFIRQTNCTFSFNYIVLEKKCTLRNAFYFLRTFLGTFPSLDSGMKSGEESKGTRAAYEPMVPHFSLVACAHLLAP